MAKERLSSETPGTPGNGNDNGPQSVVVPPFPAPPPALALFDRFQKLLRFDATKKWTYFPLERIEFCNPGGVIL